MGSFRFACLKIFFVVVFHIISIHSSHIQIDSNGGYSKIVVAIPAREKQSQELLNQLKEFLTDVSYTLQNVTRNHTFFREVQILLPSSWNDSLLNSYPDATFESYYEADIRLDSFNPLPNRSDLYTHQPRGCGEIGDFIYLNPSFIEEWNNTKSKSSVTKFVQQWSKLRYGVFDEFGDGSKLHPEFYIIRNGTARQTGCRSSNSKFVSVMDTSDLNGDLFCDSQQHNRQAPTPQNILCHLKSTWEVVKNSEDFRNVHQPSGTFIKPKYNIVKAAPIQVVLVIDPLLCDNITSKPGHMLPLAIKQFIDDFPINGKIASVIADDRTNELQLEIRNKTEHFEAIQTMAITANKRNRSILAGVEAGIRMLRNSPSQTGHLILISDGPDLDPSVNLQSVFSQLDSLHFFLITWTRTSSSFGYSVESMQDFVKRPTKCVWMDIRVDTTIENCDPKARIQLEDAFNLFYTRYGFEDFYPKKIKIHEVSSVFHKSTFVTPIDNAKLHFDLYFCKLDNDTNQMGLEIDGKEVSKDVLTNDALQSLFTRYVLDSTLPQNSKVFYKWKVSPTQETTSSIWLQFDDNIQPEVILTGQIEKDSVTNKNLLISWKFFAFSPNEDFVDYEITTQIYGSYSYDLRDNGNGDPDVIGNDKMYSRYFFNSGHGNNWYSFRVITKNKDGMSTGITSIGSFYFQGTDSRRIPPNRIADYHVDEIYNDEVILTWTAPGDQYDLAESSVYYVMNSTNFEDVANIEFDANTFEKLPRYPRTAGRVEYLFWTPPAKGVTYYCIIMSFDEDNVPSEMSNIASVYIQPDDFSSIDNSTTSLSPLENNSNYTIIPTAQLPEKAKGFSKLVTVEVVAISIGFNIAFVLIIVIYIIFRLTRTNIKYQSKII